MSHTETLTVSRIYKDGGGIVKEDNTEVPMEIGHLSHAQTLCKVGTSSRMTLNMGNFESIQLEVSISLPSSLEEVEDCYLTAKQLVEKHLNTEVAAIREYRDSKKS